MKSYITAFFFLISFSSYAQFTTLDSLSSYLQGTWQLKSHYYSIAGIQDTFPTASDNYKFIFSEIESDSTVRIVVYNNSTLLKSEEAKIRPSFNNWDTWMIDLLPSVLFDDWTWFPMIVSDHYSTQDTMSLSDNVPDGSSIIMIRSEFINRTVDLDETLFFKLYPNPVSTNRIYIADPFLADKNISVMISDASGRLLAKIPSHKVGTGISLAACPNGTLFISCEHDGHAQVAQVMKVD